MRRGFFLNEEEGAVCTGDKEDCGNSSFSEFFF